VRGNPFPVRCVPNIWKNTGGSGEDTSQLAPDAPGLPDITIRDTPFPFSGINVLQVAGWLLAVWVLAGCAADAPGVGEVANNPAGASPIMATITPEPTSTPTEPATVTPSPSATPTLTPTPTNSVTPTASPSPTHTATVTPSPTPTATETPIPPPTNTPVPTAPPTPELDFVISFWRLVPLAENSGCAKGMHSIFITVLDAEGNPLNDIIVGDTWNNVEVVSGQKGIGKAEINLWTNTMELIVKGDVQGNSYSSEASFPFSSFMTTIPNDQMIAGGYCANELECDWKREFDSYYCGGHYSWEVVFQKAY
jgi:hypothetical protein